MSISENSKKLFVANSSTPEHCGSFYAVGMSESEALARYLMASSDRGSAMYCRNQEREDIEIREAYFGQGYALVGGNDSLWWSGRTEGDGPHFDSVWKNPEKFVQATSCAEGAWVVYGCFTYNGSLNPFQSFGKDLESVVSGVTDVWKEIAAFRDFEGSGIEDGDFLDIAAWKKLPALVPEMPDFRNVSKVACIPSSGLFSMDLEIPGLEPVPLDDERFDCFFESGAVNKTCFN